MPLSKAKFERQQRLLPVVIRAAAWSVIAAASAQLCAWVLEPAWLEELYPRLYDMKFNTALALLTAGAGLVAALRKHADVAVACGTFVLAIGALSMGQHLSGLSFGIDQLFWSPNHNPASPYPGRISPGTSIALTCIGTELLLLARPSKANDIFADASEILGFFAFAVGAGGAVGYLIHLQIAYDWGTYTRMSPHTAISLMLLGAGAIALSWHRQERRVARIPLWVPIALCFLVLLLDLSTPRGLATATVYVPLVFCSLWFTRPHAPFVFAAIATVLAATAFFAKADVPIDPSMVLVNRFIAITAIWVVALVIHMRRGTERALSQAETKLKAVVTHAVDGLITIDAAGKVDSFNPACERMFGYSADEVVGRGIEMLMPEPYRGEHAGYITRYLQTGQARIIGTAGRELTGQRKDGTTFPLDLSISAFELEDGRHFAGIVRDITARKEVEKANALLASIVESSGDAVIGQSLDGKIVYWNAGAERLFGFTAEQAVGKGAGLIVPADCRDDERLILTKVRAGETIENFETESLCRHGVRRHVSLTVSPIKDPKGAVVAVSKVARDIADRKDAESELLRHAMALERSNRDLDDFAYIASHDLKEPLRGLSNNARFLRDDHGDKLGPDGIRRLDRIRYLSARMERLINDLLYFSRLGRQDLAIQHTDINAVVAGIAADLEAAETSGHAVFCVPHPLPELVCDKTRVTEIFRNLISNALKYNDSPDKIVEIGCFEEVVTPRGRLRQVFYVKDNGIGIAKEFHDEVFRIFKRLNEEDDTKKGTGAGLTFVRKIVERHGGRIWLDSAPGEGTTFYFTLRKQGPVHAAA